METKKEKIKVGAGRMVLWQSRAVSLAANMMVMGYLSIYCTDSLKLSAGIVGTLLMLSKIFDGFTDIFAGYIVDRTNTKIGRGRPYELSIIGVWLCTWLMFSCPASFSTITKAVWIFVMYTFVNSIFTTFLNAGNTVYMVRAFPHPEQHVALSTYGAIITMIITVGVSVSLPIMMGRIATSLEGWRAMIAMFAVPFAVIGMLRFFFIKETYQVDVNEERVRLKDIFTVLKTNPYIYIVAVMMLIFNLITNMGVGIYYYRYIVKNTDLFSAMAGIQVITVPLMALYPFLIKKIGKVNLIKIGLVLSAAGSTSVFFCRFQFPFPAYSGYGHKCGNCAD